MSFQKLQSQMQGEFLRASINLASKSITNWGKWDSLDNFPKNGTWEEKILFVDRLLQDALAPKEYRPNDRMFWRTSPDLNKYRGWLVHKVLQHQLDYQNGERQSGIILPEDLPKLVDDLYAFHKHHREIAKKKGEDSGTIQSYKSLSELKKVVEPYAAQYPLDIRQREANHKKYLVEFGGNGEAVLISKLKDGTELIQVLTERASRAYGSPRWCTAYPNQATYFDSYKNDLLIAIDPDGQRWQFHFETGQLHDENDRTIKDIKSFFEARDDLASALLPYWEKNISNHAALLGLALYVSPFKKRALEEYGTLHQYIKSKRSDAYQEPRLFDAAKLFPSDEDFQTFLEPYIFNEGIKQLSDAANKDGYLHSNDFETPWGIIMSCPAWRKRALDEGQFIQSMNALLSAKTPQTDTFLNIVKKHAVDPDIKQEIFTKLFDPCLDAFKKAVESDTVYTDTIIRFYKFFMADPAWQERAKQAGIDDIALPFVDRGFKSCEQELLKPKEEGGIKTILTPEMNSFLRFCLCVKDVPAWDSYAKQKGYYGQAVSNGSLDIEFDKYQGLAAENKFFGWHGRELVKTLWPIILTTPEWREHARKKDKVGKMLTHLFAPQPKGLNHFSRHKNDPHLTFMYMMPLFYNQPEFRDALTPYIAQAFSEGMEQNFSYRRIGSPKNIGVEILKHATHYKPWSDQIKPQILESSIDSIKMSSHYRSILEMGKNPPYGHWTRVIVRSGILQRFLSSPNTLDKEKDLVLGLASDPFFEKALAPVLSAIRPPQSQGNLRVLGMHHQSGPR